MSVEAITWALTQRVDRSSAKFVLVAMANCANSDMTCWPSVQYLTDATCQDRKTVIENLKRLRDQGFIKPSGEHRGRTSQVVVYALVTSADEQSQIRNSSGIGTVPKLETKSPVSPLKESRFPPEAVPKTGHGTVNEPSVEPSRKRKDKPQAAVVVTVTAEVLIEAGFDALTAADFIAHKAALKAPLTTRAWADHLRESGKAGWTPMDAAEKVMARGWKGFDASYVEAKSAKAAPQGRPPKTFSAQADSEARAKVHAWTGGLLGKDQNTIEMEAAHGAAKLLG